MNSPMKSRSWKPKPALATRHFRDTDVERIEDLNPTNKAQLDKATKYMSVGIPVCSVHEGDDSHLGIIKEFGMAFQTGIAPQAVARTSVGGWIAVGDLVQCLTPQEQRRLQNEIRARHGMCSVEEWERRNKERVYA